MAGSIRDARDILKTTKQELSPGSNVATGIGFKIITLQLQV